MLTSPSASNAALEVTGLTKAFAVDRGLFGFAGRGRQLLAVNNVSFSVQAGSTLAIVGESGCGKSTIARLVTGLSAPTAGSLRFDGEKLSETIKARPVSQRRKLQMVFQDPFSSLNPRWRVGPQIAEPMLEFGLAKSKADAKDKAMTLLADVGLARSDYHRFPHQFSGGQRQRVCIARALASDPKLIVWDEPTSALDVSVQAQILNLMRRLQRERGLTYVFISHSLGVIYNIADTIAVMYLGSIVETGPAEQVLTSPTHPYTQMLIAAAPSMRTMVRNNGYVIRGEVPNPIDPPSGCAFRTRCPIAIDACAATAPKLRPLDGERQVACDRYEIAMKRHRNGSF